MSTMLLQSSSITDLLNSNELPDCLKEACIGDESLQGGDLLYPFCSDEEAWIPEDLGLLEVTPQGCDDMSLLKTKQQTALFADAFGVDCSPAVEAPALPLDALLFDENTVDEALVSSHDGSSPASSGTSYMPTCSGSGSDCAEGRKRRSPRSPLSESGKATTSKVDPRIGRRKPDIDLNNIQDINERRKQRRLAKNRVTAATSRARKRERMTDLEREVAMLAAENTDLRSQLASCFCSRSGAVPVRDTALLTRS